MKINRLDIKIEEKKIDRIEQSIKISEQNRTETIEHLVDTTEYKKIELDTLTNEELEEMVLSIETNKITENKIVRFADFMNEDVQQAQPQAPQGQEQGQPQNLEGGQAEGMTLEDIAKKHNVPVGYFYKILESAIKIEMEHTTERSLAEKIVRDHLLESPLYYNAKHGLPAMEKELENFEQEDTDEIISSQLEDEQKIQSFDDYAKKESE